MAGYNPYVDKEEEEEEEEYPGITRNSDGEAIDLTKQRTVDNLGTPVPKGHVRVYTRQKKIGPNHTKIDFRSKSNPVEVLTRRDCFTQFRDPKQREVYLFGNVDTPYENKALFKDCY